MLFRTLARKLTSLLVLEASRRLRHAQLRVRTPLEEIWSPVLDEKIVAIPILRAGLCMLEPVVELFPDVSVGYVGLERDEESAEARAYYLKLPAVAGRTVFLLDPMLATGGSAAQAANEIAKLSPSSLSLLCMVAAPEGVARLEAEHPDLHVFTVSLDRELNDRKFILPGLGDFGDRLYGT
jgi:uracil phosphoribosyltransferase